jgi:uncharacterized Rmd1/YagE family protein
MEKKGNSRDWIDILSKLLPGIGAVIAGIFIPLVISMNSEKNRSNQLYAEIVSKREASDTELRARMFENLISSFFGDVAKHKAGKKEQLTLLRLVAFNFHESFDLRPLFEGLESELGTEERESLKDIAREIVAKQEAMLSYVKEGLVFRKTLYQGAENGIMVPPVGQQGYKGHRLGIEASDIGKDNDYVVLRVVDISDENKEVGDNVEVQFKLSYYDMPFVDNTKLFDNARFAITLKEIGNDKDGNKTVTIKVIFFPEGFMSSRDRPYLDEMLEQLRISKKGI